MQSEYIFEWWHVPVVVVGFIAGAWLYSKVWDNYKYRNYNDSYRAKLKERKRNK